MLAKKAVSVSTLLLDERFATSSARWKDNSTVVVAYKALYVNIVMRSLDRNIVVMPRNNLCLNELSLSSTGTSIVAEAVGLLEL
mmetsp:Transcript_25853/g.39637  ORF Transcript_25853/g.39637 Transcript_25853/m.39637 type:complete len:84 (-) Transcript_25853:2419-2670(-)